MSKTIAPAAKVRISENGPYIVSGNLPLSKEIIGTNQADVMYAKAPYTVLQRAVNIHPGAAEPIPTVPGELRPMA
jgi:hypothetical protein